jgi:hypothetical protein
LGNAANGVFIPTGNSISIKSTTGSGNGASGIYVNGNAVALSHNRAYDNGFAGGTDGSGFGIVVDLWTSPPTRKNVAGGNGDPQNCFAAALC